jgi:pimeloyl-ACP methyl ester carboxylesterase
LFGRARLACLLTVTASVAALIATPLSVQAADSEAAHATGTTRNGTWVLDVPANFNGTLLVWSHGYSFTPVDATNAPSVDTRKGLLDAGYALIGSSYAGGGAGWAVRPGVRAGLEAIDIATDRIGATRVDHVLVWGQSLGGLITQTIAERRPDLVDGVAPLCGVLAGTNRNLDLALDVAVAVKEFFSPRLKLHGYRSREQAQRHLDRATAAIMDQLSDSSTQASATGRMLAIAALMGVPAKTRAYSGSTTPSAVGAATESVITALTYGTIGRYDIEQRVGGNPSTNLGVDYQHRVTSASLARYTAFGFGEGLLRSYAITLDAFGARVAADPTARRAASRLGNPTGNLSDPTITMHTEFDPLVIVQNERVFQRRVDLAGDASQLVQLYVAPPQYDSGAPYGAGHCAFAPNHHLGVITALDGWVRTGARPSESSLNQLFAATPGALKLDYVPAGWPAR